LIFDWIAATDIAQHGEEFARISRAIDRTAAYCLAGAGPASQKMAYTGLLFNPFDFIPRQGAALKPWIVDKGDFESRLRKTEKKIIRAACLRDELSFTSLRHGAVTEGADSHKSVAYQIRNVGPRQT